MIGRDILGRLVPEPPTAGIDPDDLPDFIREDNVLRKLALWADLARNVWLSEGLGRLILPFPFYSAAAVGIIPVGGNAEAIDDFAVVSGFQFGIVVYALDPRAARFEVYPRYIRARESDPRIPVHFQIIDFTEHVHPSGGRSAAVVSGGPDDYLLTARHNVAHLLSGSPLMLQPSAPWPSAAVYQKMTGCVDAALLGPVTPLVSGVGLGAPNYVAARIGQTVDLRLGSAPVPQQATVMQSFLPSPAYLTVVQPDTFLFDICGVHGDSGAAIATAAGDAVGMYLGETTVEDQAGQMHRMGFGLDINQCLNLFNVTLKGAIL